MRAKILLSTVIGALLITGPAMAQSIGNIVHGLSIASAGVSDIAGRLKLAEKATGEEKCAEYRGHSLGVS